MTNADQLRLVAGRGARVWDSTGQEYIDWICGYGPVVIGHGDPRIATAVFHQLLAGTLLPGGSDLEYALGERLLSHYRSADSFVFVKTGSEAVAAAIRFARAHTGRRQVLRVGFHGWHGGLIDPKIGWHNWDNLRTPGPHPPGVGSPDELGIETNLASTADEIETRLRATDAPALAALVLDPIQLADPATGLAGLRRACDDTGALLVLDETKTAFRVALGGVQTLYGIHADLTIAGKALANGLPLSTVLGSSDVVQGKRTRVKGTFNGERAALAAAHATLDVLEHDDVCQHLDTVGTALIAEVNKALDAAGLVELVTAVPYRWSSMPHLHAPTSDPKAQRVRHELIDGARHLGVLLLEGHNSFVNAAHTIEDAARTADAIHDVAQALNHPSGRT